MFIFIKNQYQHLKGKVIIKNEDTWFYRYENLITYTTLVFSIVYILGMFIFPWTQQFSWSHVHGVWMSWQTLNVGVIAYISTFFFFKATKHSENIKRKRNFKAEKAFLPNALSELDSYFFECSKYLNAALTIIKGRGYLHDRPTINEKLPALQIKHEEVFRQCILMADNNIADHLSGILMRLQIFRSRMEEVDRFFRGTDGSTQTAKTIMRRMSDLAEIHNMCSSLYDFARGISEFKKEDFNLDTIYRSYHILKIHLHGLDSNELEEITLKRINEGGLMRNLTEKSLDDPLICP